MTFEQEQDLIKRVKALEDNSIRLNMLPSSKENLKNALFEGFVQADKEAAADANTSYIEIIWKNKSIKVPYSI
jgi:hypothetical protein